VLIDDDEALFPGGFPKVQVLNEDMALRVYDRHNYAPALQSLLE
jgi:hypothetical protein